MIYLSRICGYFTCKAYRDCLHHCQDRLDPVFNHMVFNPVFNPLPPDGVDLCQLSAPLLVCHKKSIYRKLDLIMNSVIYKLCL